MRLSELFSKTQREVPIEADTVSHQLMLRAGMIRQLTAGVYSYLPLALRVIRKIEDIIRDEMNKAGGQEISLPVLQPIELWQQTGRDTAFGKGLFTLSDRRQRRLVLGPTHEEVITDLIINNVQSYRDLPLLLYQIQTKFRDEPRPRGGLVRVREFSMKDLYSFDTDEVGLSRSYQKMLTAYGNIYNRCQLSAKLVEADSGAIGGKDSHEFIVISDIGEDQIFYCEKCDYAANAEKAKSIKSKTKNGTPLPVEEVATPGHYTIEEVSEFLEIPRCCTLKAVFYFADGALVFAVIRGDIEVNEVKLKNVLNCTELRLATEDEVRKAGIVIGSASPVGLKNIKIIADNSVTSGSNFVAGANKVDTHLRNVNYPRDFQADIVTDISLACAGETCPGCGDRLLSEQGIEIGHVFKLGTFISEKLGAFFINSEGDPCPIVMGCYGIGIGRLMAAIIELHHDDKGIIWPLSIAPFTIYLCPLFTENDEVHHKAESLYTELETQGFEVLYDDRSESTGVKFNDADLMGIPLRVTISPRSMQRESIELKWRSEKKTELVSLNKAVERIKELISAP
ncbi:MAG: proline--tRNA ligase [Dehalococcoidia bacterium]|nr:MAG: proline--tRNA ligase [Dehalococcoidia bacterium]